MNTKTTNKHYDLQGLEMLRVIRLITLWKILRIDDIGGKPRLWDLLQLAVHHYAGRFAAIVTVKHEKRWLRSLVLMREYLARASRLAGRVKQRSLSLFRRSYK